jgi:outer membrane protein assembly factor BamB
MRIVSVTTFVALMLGVCSALAQPPHPIQPRQFDPPPVTTWVPEGCREVPADDPLAPSREGYRRFHSDSVNSDEITRVSPPVIENSWTRDESFFIGVGPTFDSEGNNYYAPFQNYRNDYYFSPFAFGTIDPAGDPMEYRKLISRDSDGNLRWVLDHPSEASPGASTPMILNDPDNPGDEVVYLALNDRMFALKTDGTLIYDSPTGLPATTPDGAFQNVIGINYQAQADVVMSLAVSGALVVKDRATGENALSDNVLFYQVPGEPTPPGAPPALPPPVIAGAELIFKRFVNLGSLTFLGFIDALLGNGRRVVNDFGVDQRTGRIWIGGTAPDGEDGAVDGVSELGALYAIDLVPRGGKYDAVEACHYSFAGGTASTPTLNQSGTRIYIGDNEGKLVAIDTSNCEEIWSVDVGGQIVTSLAVSSDKGEIYAATFFNMIKVIDDGATGAIEWVANLDAFQFLANPLPLPPPPNGPGPQPLFNFQLLNAGITANSVSVHIGAGPVIGFPLPLKLGVGELDRETGELRYFTEGPEESIAAMNTGPDGSVYLGNAPFRRIIARVIFGDLTAPIIGGTTKYGAQRQDLIVRDATCAAEARAQNAFDYRMVCPESSEADVVQLENLISQARTVAPQAIEDGDLSASDWSKIDKELMKAEKKLATGKLQHLQPAANAFRRACAVLE